MAKVKLQIQVQNPCTEDWEAMPVQGEGRFCAVCQKCVIDFTGKTDRELAEFFAGNHQEICGNFRDDQLNRKILLPQQSRFSGWQALLLAFGTLLTSSVAFSQSAKPVKPNYASATPVAPTGKFQIVQGTVHNRDGEPAAGVTIKYKGKNALLAISDANGNFAFKVFESKTQTQKPALVFTKVGYLPVEKTVSISEKNKVSVMLEQMLPLDPIACQLDLSPRPEEKPEPRISIRGTRGATGTIYYVNGMRQLHPQKGPEESNFTFRRKL